MKDKIKQIATLTGGFLTALMAFLATLNVEYQWLTTESIGALESLIVAGGLLVVGAIGTWGNTYVSKKGKEQEKALKEKGLK